MVASHDGRISVDYSLTKGTLPHATFDSHRYPQCYRLPGGANNLLVLYLLSHGRTPDAKRSRSVRAEQHLRVSPSVSQCLRRYYV
jgi:hypothetical protein